MTDLRAEAVLLIRKRADYWFQLAADYERNASERRDHGAALADLAGAIEMGRVTDAATILAFTCHGNRFSAPGDETAAARAVLAETSSPLDPTPTPRA